LQRSLAFRHTTRYREQQSEAVLAGNWIKAHLSPDARILYDPYTYVPPTFADAHVTPWGGTVELLEALQPDVALVNSLSSDQFSDASDAVRYARDEAAFMTRHDYYEALRDGTAGLWLVRDFGTIQVYIRQNLDLPSTS
jgi:hypothetical protein